MCGLARPAGWPAAPVISFAMRFPATANIFTARKRACARASAFYDRYATDEMQTMFFPDATRMQSVGGDETECAELFIVEKRTNERLLLGGTALFAVDVGREISLSMLDYSAPAPLPDKQRETRITLPAAVAADRK